MDWIKTEDKLPKAGEKVCIMTYDASGYNAEYNGALFIAKDTDNAFTPEQVAYWCEGENFTAQIKKKCGMCGRI